MPNTITKKVKAVNLGPGGGEYVYHPELIKASGSKILNSIDGKESHLQKTVARFKEHYPNLAKVQIPIGWFGDTLKAGDIHIVPKIESLAPSLSDTWSVGVYTKVDAELVSRTGGNVNWGGTPSDKSIIYACNFLKSNSYKVSLMPLIYMDMPGKPWRGDIKAVDDSAVDHFFAEYAKMINHYAALQHEQFKLKDLIDSFVIGSEFKALLAYQNANSGEFYAVQKMIELIKDTSAILGNKVKVTYAANWGEYHHNDNGWHHLDPIWTLKEISYVGINAYFPLTEKLAQSSISYESVVKAWKSGENYDYYLDANGNQQVLSPEWAAKDIEFWWRNRHQDPDGELTKWKPKAKKVVFTELGFASVEGTTNQPYKFVDINNFANSLPVGSSGQDSIMAQAIAINATLDFWKEIANHPGNSNLVGEDIFLYTIDVRYGFQEHPELYSDHNTYKYSHAIKLDEL